MTREQFMKRLGLVPGEWHVEDIASDVVPGLKLAWAAIRNQQGQCPVEAVAGVPQGCMVEGIDRLALEQFIEITTAADMRTSPWPDIRQELLVACGLASTGVA